MAILGANRHIVVFPSRECGANCPDCIIGRVVRASRESGRASSLPLGALPNLARGIGRNTRVTVEECTHPQFFKLLRGVALAGPREIVLVTNGRLFTRSQSSARAFARSLKAAVGGVPVRVMMSVDAQHAGCIAPGAKGVRALALRAERFRDAFGAVGVKHGFWTRFAAGVTWAGDPAAVRREFGLPTLAAGSYLGATPASPWIDAATYAYLYDSGRVHVSWDGSVHLYFKDFLDGRPAGSILVEPLDRIMRRRPLVAAKRLLRRKPV
ncbi:MAG: hypothetical protein AABW54_02565 [Candidatus Micrarchaeota archaeon]